MWENISGIVFIIALAGYCSYNLHLDYELKMHQIECSVVK
jgi:hypothetical protein